MPGTFSLQHTLPRLPVPSLQESCALYLQSLKPLQTPEEHARTEKLVADFVSSELGKSLQQRLLDIDRVSPNNWLEDNFWLRKAYLEWRDPLMVNSNWYMLGVDDAHHPQELLANNGAREEGHFTAFQIRRAAHLAHRSLEYKEFIQNETLPIDMLKKDQPQCMWQYTRIYGITRVPLLHCDGIIQQDLSKTHHIIVLVQNQVYKLPVYHQDGRRYTLDEIERGLLAIVHHVQQLKDEKQKDIPLLTSWDRDNWANARNYLLTLDPVNRASLSTIESALFAIALDDYSHGADMGSWTKTALCGKGGKGHNRWFDKSITIVVESNGKCHLAGEHSPCDALTVSWAWDYTLKEPCPGPLSSNVIQPLKPDSSSAAGGAADQHVQHLVFKTDATIDRYIAEAQVAADKTSALSDSYVLIFDEYGTNWVKKTGKVPPDAFYQMVLQIAYYRLHKKVTATYETGSTRKYLRGRTDTIRTCSVDTKQLVENFDNPKLDAKAKYDLLVKATASHRKYTKIANEGRACDRHLMVLKLLNADHVIHGKKVSMHPMFEDPIFKESQTWRLSTSGLQAGIRIMGTGFGAASQDGYGVNYMAAPTLVKFGIECKNVPETVSARAFGDALKRVLLDLKVVCEAVNNNQSQQQQQREQAKI